MTKPQIIKKIKKIIAEWGSFNSGEVEQNDGQSVGVGQMGGLVALAEYFTKDDVEVNVYDTTSMSCDPIHTYNPSYEDLSKAELEDILIICEFYEAEQLQTEKRISN